MEYLTVGRDEINKELIQPIHDSTRPNHLKPTGGIWLSRHFPEYPNYNDWVDYLVNNPNVLFYKSHKHNLWLLPCSVVGLKEDAKIYNLGSLEEFNYLVENYPLDDKMFSYEKLSEVYDGIYIDTMGLSGTKNETVRTLNSQCAITSLLLFNTDAIDYYYQGNVVIDPFDLEYYMYEDTNYKINYNKIKKRVK